MNDSQELIINLKVRVSNGQIEHDLELKTEEYTADSTQRIQEVINEDIKYFIEDIRRRITIL